MKLLVFILSVLAVGCFLGDLIEQQLSHRKEKKQVLVRLNQV